MEKTAQVPGRRCHVKNRPNPNGPGSVWQYEEVQLQNIQNTNSLLVRVMIGKVEDLARLITILRSIPVIQNDPGWRCRTWCANALAAIAADGKAVGDFSVGLAADRTGCEVVRWTNDCSGSLCDLGAPDKTQANLGFAGGQRNDTVNIMEIVIHPFVGCHYAVL